MFRHSRHSRKVSGFFAVIALVASLLAAAASPVAAAGPVIFSESFETTPASYSVSTPEFSDGFGDFFTRTDGSNIGTFYSVSGQEGDWWFAAQDLDGEGAAGSQTLSISGINIAGETDLNFSALFAEDDDGTNQDWDENSSVIVKAQIDGAGYVSVFAIEAAAGTFNTEPRVDTDFDGVGDGVAITDTFALLGGALIGTGTTLDLIVEINFLDAGDEDISIDNIQITSGAPVASPPRINELHYDNAGSDVGEFIEVRTEAGADVSGLVVTLYNGSNGTSYNSAQVAGGTVTTDGTHDYYVLSIGGIQNGSPDGLALSDGGTTIEFLSYEGTLVATDGPANGTTSVDIGADETSSTPVDSSIQRSDNGTTWALTSGTNTAGAANDLTQPLDPAFIHEIQGSGPSVAITTPVHVEAIVTSLFTRDDALDGFFIQEEDADADADPATSEGIFVFCRGNCPANIAVGDLAVVEGTPADFFGMSQIGIGFGSGTVTVASSGNPLPSAVAIDLPAAGDTEAEATFEAAEGMIVTFPDTLAVSEYFELARYGQIVLTETERPYQFTDENTPSVAGYAAFLDDLATRRIILDDDNNDQNDTTSDGLDEDYPYPFGGLSTTNRVRGGDTITNLTGVMHWSFAGQNGTDAWRVRPIDGVNNTFTPTNPAPASPDDVGGSLKVASFNVLNYFTTLDLGSGVCGPTGTAGCRGANSAAELANQKAKIVSALAEMDADVVGLIELENDGDDSSIADLVAGLNDSLGAGTYDYVPTGFIGGDAIKVGYIYKPATVSLVNDFALLDMSVDPTFLDSKNRPALIQTFAQISTDERVTVAVNHLKSKGSSCGDVGDPEPLDGQANCAATRTAAAIALAKYLDTDPTGSGDPDSLIIGDLNSYAMEDPIMALINAGYTDLLDSFVGDDAYSYLFDGQLGYLDYAMANGALLGQVSGTTAWHINGDEVPLFDYNDAIRDPGEASFHRESSVPTLFAPDPLRSSDHDPVLVGLDLDSIPENPTCMGHAATIIGTPGDDVIVGTNKADVIVTFGGNDTISGGNGKDIICSGFGNDVIDGGNGKDIIDAGDSDDIVMGGNAKDVIFGRGGNDELNGGRGVDDLDGGDGIDTCVAGENVVACELP